jgi:hypothetical protein
MRRFCLLLVLVAYACGDDDAAVVVDAGGPDATPLAPISKLDVLLVIDDSGAMFGPQDSLAAGLPAFHAALVSAVPELSCTSG